MKSVLRWIRDAWLVLGVTLLLVLLVNEVLKSWIPENSNYPRVRAGASAPDRRHAVANADAQWLDEYYREHRQARTVQWQPYLYWRRQQFDGDMINIDQDGHRLTLPTTTAREARQVLVFGGSTIWGTGVRDRHTIPSEIAALLKRQGIQANITNLGESGYVSSQGLISLLRELHKGVRPDLVIFYDGVNDVFSALQSGRAGLPQNEDERQRDFRVTNGLDNYLAGFIATLEGINRLAAQNASEQALPDTETLAGQLVDTYLVNVKSIQALGATFGFKTLFFWQPSVFSRTTPAPGEQRIIDASLAFHRDLQLAADEALRQHTGHDPQVIDLTGLFDNSDESVYLDFCHLSEAGNQQVAAIMVDYFPLFSD